MKNKSGAVEGLSPTRGYQLEVRTEEDGTWTIVVPDLPGCVATGDSIDEAIGALPEVIDLWIEAAQERGDVVPQPTRDEDYSGKFMLRIPKSLHRLLARRAGIDGTSLNAYCVQALTQVAYSQTAREGFVAEFRTLLAARWPRTIGTSLDYQLSPRWMGGSPSSFQFSSLIVRAVSGDSDRLLAETGPLAPRLLPNQSEGTAAQ